MEKYGRKKYLKLLDKQYYTVYSIYYTRYNIVLIYNIVNIEM